MTATENDAARNRGAGIGRREWVLVPREPTREMLDAPEHVWPPEALKAWNEMLAAAPQPPADAQAQDYTDIANRAQEITGRSIWPSTVKAVLEIACRTAPPSAPVGVEGLAQAVRVYLRAVDSHEDDCVKREARETVNAALAQQPTAVAPVWMGVDWAEGQQPAAVGEVRAYPLWQAIHAASAKAGHPCNVGLAQVVDALDTIAQPQGASSRG